MRASRIRKRPMAIAPTAMAPIAPATIERSWIDQYGFFYFQEQLAQMDLGNCERSISGEFFNIFNRVNFAPPLDHFAITDPAFGTIDRTQTSSRQIQFGLKILW
ncbi:MAG: hypothetical protein ABR880_23100 [Candidatus Sulfotelmatobacter sp.]